MHALPGTLIICMLHYTFQSFLYGFSFMYNPMYNFNIFFTHFSSSSKHPTNLISLKTLFTINGKIDTKMEKHVNFENKSHVGGKC